MKTDLSIRNICIASIKRKYSGLANWHFTRHFETETFSDIDDRYKLSDIHLNELPISQVVIDASNWTLITTRQIITCYNGVTKTMAATDVKGWHWNDFKGYRKTPYTVGRLEVEYDRSHKIFICPGEVEDLRDLKIYIETGIASIVTIYAIMTLTSLVKNRLL
jgi:hypothetical protein